MEKIWFILINGYKEGPYNLIDLKGDSRITPDTLIWKQGFKKWVPIRNVSELKAVFEDSTEHKEDEDGGQKDVKKLSKKRIQDDEVIALRSEPPFTYLWLFIALILLYALYKFYL